MATQTGIGIDLGLGPDPTAAILCRFDAGAATPAAWWTLRPGLGDWPVRIARMGAALRALLTQQRPSFVAYAAPHLRYFGGGKGKAAAPNPQTLRKLAALEGALLLACADAGVATVIDVQEAQSKVALAGHGQATKQAMIDAAAMYYRLTLSEHEADALGHLLAGEAKLRGQALAGRASR